MTLEHSTMIEALGWAATATFIGSYFFSRAETLVRVQMAGGAMWVIYGALVHAQPVVAANLLVVIAAAWKTWRPKRGAATLSPQQSERERGPPPAEGGYGRRPGSGHRSPSGS